MVRRHNQAAEAGDAALAAARVAAAGDPFAALSGLLGGASGAGTHASLGSGADIASLASLGMFAPAALAQSHAALLGGVAPGGAGPGPAADLAALARASAPGGAEPPGSSEMAGAGAAWDLVAAKTRGDDSATAAAGGAASGGGAPPPALSVDAALRALGGGHSLARAAQAHAQNMHALSVLYQASQASQASQALQSALNPALSPALAQLGALGGSLGPDATRLHTPQSPYAGGLGPGAGFPGGLAALARAGPGSSPLGNLSALHALGVLSWLSGGASAPAAGVSAPAPNAEARAPPAPGEGANDGDAPGDDEARARVDVARVPTTVGKASEPTRSGDEGALDAPSTAATGRTGSLSKETATARDGCAKAEPEPEPPTRASRVNPFGEEPEGYSLVHAAKRAKRDAIAVATDAEAKAE